MIQYVKLEDVTEVANHLMNILWDRNREMSLEELKKDLELEYTLVLNEENVKQYMEELVDMDYAESRYDDVTSYYISLGWQEQY